MSNTSDVCPICGGVKRVDWTISFEECHPVEMRFDPVALVGNWRLCPGHPVPTTKHEGKLDEHGDGVVLHGMVYHGKSSQGIHLDYLGDHFTLTSAQALSLLAWLLQERETLERLAKEQEA